MPQFKAFLKVIWNRRVIVFLYTFIFLAIAIINVRAGGSSPAEFSASKLNIGVIDCDNTAASRRFTDFLKAHHDVTEISFDKDRLLNEIYYDQNYYAVQINKGFESRLSEGDTRGLFTEYCIEGSYNAGYAQAQINKYIKCTAAYAVQGQSIEKAMENAEKTLSDKTKMTVVSEGTDNNGGLDSSIYMYCIMLAYILLAAVFSALVPALMAFREKDLSDRINASCLSHSKQLFQTILGTVVFAGGMWLVFMLAGQLMFGSRLSLTQKLCMITNAFVYTIVSVSIAMLVSMLIKNPRLTDMIVNVIGLGMSFICGVFVSQKYLGEGVLTAAHALPAYWYVRAAEEASKAPSNIDISKEAGFICIEFVFAAVIFAAALIVSKKRTGKQ